MTSYEFLKSSNEIMNVLRAKLNSCASEFVLQLCEKAIFSARNRVEKHCKIGRAHV